MPPCAMRSSTGLRPGNGHRLGSPTIRPTRSSPIGALMSGGEQGPCGPRSDPCDQLGCQEWSSERKSAT